jgi:hypothetical protein
LLIAFARWVRLSCPCNEPNESATFNTYLDIEIFLGGGVYSFRHDAMVNNRWEYGINHEALLSSAD